jgi:hypothetical protein
LGEALPPLSLQPAAPTALEMREVGEGGGRREVELEGRRGRIGRVKEEKEEVGRAS